MKNYDKGVEKRGVKLGIELGKKKKVMYVEEKDGKKDVIRVKKDGVEIKGYRQIICLWKDREKGERKEERGKWEVDDLVNEKN